MRFFIVAICIFFSANSLYAGRIISIDEAERICIENNLEIKAKKLDISKADAEIIGAKIIPNPAFSYSIESMKNGEKEVEQTYSITQNIDLSGKRGLKLDYAKKTKEAREYLLEKEIAEVILQLRKTYFKVLYLKENEKLLLSLLEMFEDVRKKMEERYKAGDIAESELIKFSSEEKNIKRNVETLRIELHAEKKRLALLLNSEHSDLEPLGEFVFRPLASLEISPESIFFQRPDIRGQMMLVEAGEKALNFAKKEGIPSVDVEAGYKKRTGGFNGFVFGVTIPLPLFDRNQGGIERARSELDQERINLELIKKNALYEVGTLKEKVSYLSRIIIELSEQLNDLRQLTNTARVAYEEGETGLLELLDAVRSEKALWIEYNANLYEYWVSLFELEKAGAIKAFNLNMGGFK